MKYLQHLFKVILALFLIFTCYLNTFQIDGTCGYQDRFTQFDELIAIGNVNAMLTPESAKHFVFYTISGNTVMYGRAIFYIDAITSFIPYKIWGLSGQIVATRITHTLSLLVAFYIFIILFIDKKNALLRSVIALLLCLMPYTLYFCIVPKPEPFLLLFIALFCYFSIKFNFQKLWPFLFLGLAFATKISVLSIVPIFTTFIWLKSDLPWLKKIFLTGFYFIFGLIIGVPTLLLGVVKPIYWQYYFSHTFGTIKQDYDDASITFFTWLKYIGFEYFSLYWIVIIPLLLLPIGLLIYKIVKNKKITFQQLLFVSGLFVIILVSISTKRMWPQYLYFGWVLFFFGLCSIELKKLQYTITITFLLLGVGELKTVLNHTKYLIDRENDIAFQSTKQNSTKILKHLVNGINSSPIFIDVSAYLPNSLFIKHCRYQPFESDKKPTDICIEQINNFGDQLYKNANSIVFFNSNPKTRVLAKNTIIMEDEKNALLTFNTNVPKVFYMDTAFGEIEVYKRVIK